MLALGTIEYQQRAQEIVKEIKRSRIMYEEFQDPAYAIETAEYCKAYAVLLRETGLIKSALQAVYDSDSWFEIAEQIVHEEYSRHYWENALENLKWNM